MRLLSNESFVDNQKLVTGKLSEEDWGKLSIASSALSQTDIRVDDNPAITVAEMNAKCRRLDNLGLVLIDYLQLMADQLGPVSYASDSEVFIGRDYEKTKSYSEKVAGDIDDVVRDLMMRAYARCEQLLKENGDKLDAVTEYLLSHDTMDRPAFEAVMTGACASVGKPGYGAVRIRPAPRSLPVLSMRRMPLPAVMRQPQSRKSCVTGSRSASRARLSVTSPPQAAAAQRYVAVSMRSGRME